MGLRMSISIGRIQLTPRGGIDLRQSTYPP